MDPAGEDPPNSRAAPTDSYTDENSNILAYQAGASPLVHRNREDGPFLQDTICCPLHDVIPSSPPLPSFSDPVSPTSSEPPIFSSDDPHEENDVSNYTSPRPKRKREGAWWEGSIDELGLTQPAKHMKTVNTKDGANPMQSLSPFVQRLMRGVHENKTNYDLGNMQAEDFELQQLHFLNQVIDQRHDPGQELPSDGQFRSMVPCLRLHLYGNNLRHLHFSLFQVEHLTYLSLRQNKIEELPPMITKLRNLKTLDLCFNKLRYLPAELDLLRVPCGRLEFVQLMGNPLIATRHCSIFVDLRWKIFPEFIFFINEADRYLRALWDCYHQDNHDSHLMLIAFIQQSLKDDRNPRRGRPQTPWPILELTQRQLIARTPVAYYDQRGILMRGCQDVPTEGDTDLELIIATEEGVFRPPSVYRPDSEETSVLPLSTLCLHHAVAQAQDSPLEEILPCYNPLAEKILAHAEGNMTKYHSHFLTCNCGRPFIVPRAAWIEIWGSWHGELEPYKRSVCSWKCAQRYHGYT